MVDIVDVADLLGQAVDVVDRGEYIVDDNMLRDKVVAAEPHLLKQRLFIIAALFEDFSHNGEADLLIDGYLVKLFPGEALGEQSHRVDHAV